MQIDPSMVLALYSLAHRLVAVAQAHGEISDEQKEEAARAGRASDGSYDDYVGRIKQQVDGK